MSETDGNSQARTLPITDPIDLPDHFENWWSSSNFHDAPADSYSKRKQLAWDGFYASSLLKPAAASAGEVADLRLVLSRLVDACEDEVESVFAGEIGDALKEARKALESPAKVVDIQDELLAALKDMLPPPLDWRERDVDSILVHHQPSAIRAARVAVAKAEAAPQWETTTHFRIEWLAGARPPVHPNPMTGRQSFGSFDAALEHMGRQAADAKLISLTQFETRTMTVDRTEDATKAIASSWKETSDG